MKKILIGLSCLLVTMILVSAAACKNKSSYNDVYYVSYGEWFILPAADSYEIKRADGSEVTVDCGKIFIDDIGDYKLVLKNGLDKKVSTLKVNLIKEAKIFVSADVVYGTVNKPVELPTVVAHDGVKELSVAKKLLFGDEEINIDSGFVPAKAGNYDYVLTASGADGKAIEKKVPVYIEKTDGDYKNKIASFDKPFGVNELAFAADRSSYSEDVAFEDESGSTKICFYTDYTTEITFANLERSDVSQYDAIYFYVYNGSDLNISISCMWQLWYDLAPHTWSEILITTKDLARFFDSADIYEVFKENLSLENLNGIQFSINFSFTDYVLKEDSVYLSSVRGIKKRSVGELKNSISSICGKDKISLRDISEVEFCYSQLTAQEKLSVSNYNEFRELKIDRYLKEKNIGKVEDKVLYFDSEIGRSQIVQPWDGYEFTVTDEKTYKDEKVTKIHVPAGGSEVAFYIDDPFVYDLSDYDYVTFAVYYEYKENLLLFNDAEDFKNIGVACNVELQANDWTEVILALGSMDNIEDSIFWIIQNQWDIFDSDIDFYVSSMYAKKGTNDFDGYKIPFNEESGSDYLYAKDNSAVSYTTEVKFEDEQGSTKITPAGDGAQLYLYFTNFDVKPIRGYAVFTMHIYYPGKNAYSAYILPKGYYDLTLASQTPLAAEGWTEINFFLPEGRLLTDYGIMIMGTNWLFDNEEAVYFSSMNYVRTYDDYNLDFDKDYGEQHLSILDNAAIAYSTDVKYGEEDGSTKVYAANNSDGNQLYLGFENTNAAENNMCYRMFVYYGGAHNYSLNILLKGYYDLLSSTSYKLKNNDWTEIEFLLPVGKVLSDYGFIIMDDNWKFDKNDAIYLSAFKFLRSVEVSGIEFDKPEGINELTVYKNAELSYANDIKYKEQEGSARISAKTGSDGKELYMTFDCPSVGLLYDGTFSMYVRSDSDKAYSLYIMKKNYWDPESAVSSVRLTKDSWSEIRFSIPANESLNDYAIMIMDENGKFFSGDSVYLSALEFLG